MPGEAAPRAPFVAHASLFGAAMIWGSFFPLIAVLLRTWDPYANAAGRSVFAAAVLAAILLVRNGPSAFRGPFPWRRLAILALIGVAGFNICTSLGVAHAGPVSAALVATTNPVCAAFLAWAMQGAVPRRGVFVAAAFAVAGGVIVAMAREDDTEFRGGEILILAASVAWLWYSIKVSAWFGDRPQAQVMALTYGLSAVYLVLLTPLLGLAGISTLEIDTSAQSLGLMLLVAVSSVALAVNLWLYGVRRLGVTVAAIYGNLVPVFAILVAIPLGTTPRTLEIVGGAVILVGVLIVQLGARRA
jgi:drug/metabolite transporter (DMT)-like permease